MNFKKPTLLFFLFIFLFENPSFGQNTFIPSHHGNTLKLKNKNDFKFEWGGNIEKLLYKFNTNQQLQLGYAPTNFLGVSIFHAQIKNRYESIKGPTLHKNKNTGIEIGAFHLINFKNRKYLNHSKKSFKRRGILGDFYLGYANGQLTNTYYNFNFIIQLYHGRAEMNFHKVYAHAGLHWIGRKLEFSGFIKKGKVNFYKGIIRGQPIGTDFSDITAITQNNIFTFVDYSFKSEIKFNHLGLYGQFTISQIKKLNSLDVLKGYVGILLYLNKIRKKWLPYRR